MVKTLEIPQKSASGPEWRISDAPVGYPEAVAWMEARAAAIADGAAQECVWLLQHPALYTAGTSAHAADLLDSGRFPVYPSGRGGQYTYHGPGQRVAYVLLDLKRRRQDVRAFVNALQDWIVLTLERFNVRGYCRSGRVGIWVPRPELGPGREDKIAAVGVRVRRWVTFHGISLNVDPDLDHFAGIVPCGISDQGVTSLAALGHLASIHEVDMALKEAFEAAFGPDSAMALRPALTPSA